MGNVLIEEKNILEYVYDNIYDIKNSGHEIMNAKYHHNAAYKDAVSICKYGILTLKDMNSHGIRKDSEEFLKIMDDASSHVNGDDCVSLAVVGLTDIYSNEDEYNPFSPNYVDFLVSSDIKASRFSIHYGNEFLSCSSIAKENLKSLDIRLLKLLCRDNMSIGKSFIHNILQKYNYLIEIASELQIQKLELPIREMSESNIYELDINQLAEKPKILLKK